MTLVWTHPITQLGPNITCKKPHLLCWQTAEFIKSDCMNVPQMASCRHRENTGLSGTTGLLDRAASVTPVPPAAPVLSH